MVEDSEWGRIRYCQMIGNGLWTWEIICRSKNSHKSCHRRKTLWRKSAVNWRLGYYSVGCYKGSWWRRRRWQYDGCDTRTWAVVQVAKLRSSFWSDFSTYLLQRKSSGSPKRDEKVWQSNRKPPKQSANQEHTSKRRPIPWNIPEKRERAKGWHGQTVLKTLQNDEFAMI